MTKLKPIKDYKIKDIDYVPISKAQKLMLKRDLENVFDVCLFGASGVGKTVAGIISSLGPQADGSLLTDRSEYRALYLRRESTLLKRSGLIDAAHMWYKRFYPMVEFNSVEKQFTFPSGAKITFAGVEQESDKEKFKGYTELHCVVFEELTQFSQTIFNFIVSRLRTSTNIPLRVRSTTNPGDKEEAWVLDRYKYWITKSVEILKKDFDAAWGEVFYYRAGVEGLIVTKEKPQELSYSFCGIETFINDIKPDNDKFMSAQITDPISRAQLVDGVWGLKPQSGMYFKKDDLRESFQKAPVQAVRIRYWDKACSGPKGDYLAGMLVAHYIEQGISKFMIEDLLLLKPEVSEIEKIILRTSQTDGKAIYIGFEQEPGSSGKEVVEKYRAMLLKEGYKVVIDQKRATKLDRAGFVSPISSEGRLSYIHNSVSDEMISQLINFPSKGVHDDALDALTGAVFILQTRLPKPVEHIIGTKVDLAHSYRQLQMITQTPGVFTSKR